MPLNRHSRRYWKSSTGPTARPLGPKARYRKTCVCYSFVNRDQPSFCASLGENSPMGVLRVAVLESAGDCTPAMPAQVETDDISAPRTMTSRDWLAMGWSLLSLQLPKKGGDVP